MAQLPPDGEWLIQQIDGEVILFHRDTEAVIVRFDPAEADSAAKAQRTIWEDKRLTTEQKSFGSFWSGYFYAHGRRGEQY